MEAFLLDIRDLLIIPIILVVAGIALMRGIKGRFVDMIVILGIGIVGLIVLYSPEIIEGVIQDTAGELGGGV